MRKLDIIIVLLIFGIGLASTESIYIGKKCSYDDQCKRGPFSSSLDPIECSDGFCKCKPGVELEYTSSMEPSCSITHSIRIITGDCNATSCKDNEECVALKDKGDTTWLSKSLCYCKTGFLRVNDDCVEGTYVGALEKCGRIGGENKACALEEHSRCQNGRCLCYDDYFANQTSKKCQPMAEYLKAYNLTEYRVKPNEYCAKDSHCISGLNCRYAKCACPSPCIYNSTAEICDCGTVDYRRNAIGPIIVGILLGIAIMGFWYWMIKRSSKKWFTKPSGNFSDMSGMPHDSPTQSSYALSPMSPTSNNTSSVPIGLSVPTSSTSGRQSPTPSHESLPPKPGADVNSSSPPPPPQASLYGLNPSQAPSSYPTAPPAYSETPTASDSTPPPYSLNPSADTTGAPPYSLNPSSDTTGAPPYPNNPSNLPYSVNPGGPTGFALPKE